jgi:hypothetical protein
MFATGIIKQSITAFAFSKSSPNKFTNFSVSSFLNLPSSIPLLIIAKTFSVLFTFSASLKPSIIVCCAISLALRSLFSVVKVSFTSIRVVFSAFKSLLSFSITLIAFNTSSSLEPTTNLK